MKIYTEVIYKWDDEKGKLIEISSESENYEGSTDMAMAYEDQYGQQSDTNLLGRDEDTSGFFGEFWDWMFEQGQIQTPSIGTSDPGATVTGGSTTQISGGTGGFGGAGVDTQASASPWMEPDKRTYKQLVPDYVGQDLGDYFTRWGIPEEEVGAATQYLSGYFENPVLKAEGYEDFNKDGVVNQLDVIASNKQTAIEGLEEDRTRLEEIAETKKIEDIESAEESYELGLGKLETSLGGALGKSKVEREKAIAGGVYRPLDTSSELKGKFSDITGTITEKYQDDVGDVLETYNKEMDKLLDLYDPMKGRYYTGPSGIEDTYGITGQEGQFYSDFLQNFYADLYDLRGKYDVPTEGAV